jgi:hypothetical protein
MKKLYVLFAAFCAYTTLDAQVFVTSSSGLGPTNYLSLKAAFDVINSGAHTGAIDVAITGNTAEPVSAVLNASGSGAASYSGITIHPSGGSDRSITGSVDGPMIDLNGADNVLIDGLNTGGHSLTISNISVSNINNTSTIRFINDASGNRITNTTIQGGSTGINLGTILFSTGTVTGNDNNKIVSCNITDANGSSPVNAVYSLGTATASIENSEDSIRSCTISNYFHPDLLTAGISLAAGNTNWGISDNKLFQTTARVFSTGAIHRGIQITSGKSYTVSGNTIGYATSTGTGIYQIGGANATRFIAIDLGVGTAGATSVQDNTIASFILTSTSTAGTTSGVWCAINISSGDVNVSGNTIGVTSGTGSITVTPGSGGLTVPVNTSSTGVVNISTNTIGGITMTPTANSSRVDFFGIQVTGTLGTINITNNTIGNTTAANISAGTLGTSTGTALMRAIFNTNTGTVNITGNTCQNMAQNSSGATALVRVMEYQQGTGSISGNIIRSITANGTSASFTTPEVTGIQLQSTATGIVVSNNTISQMALLNTGTAATFIAGIYLVSNVNGTMVTGNKIYGLTNASTSVSTTAPGTVAGIFLREANVSNPLTVANNMISLGGETSTTAFVGIWNQVNSTTGYTARIYYNTVNIEGVLSSGTQPSFCYHRGDFAATAFAGPVVDIRNNIFTNNRTGGTGKHYAIANSYGAVSSATGWGPGASNFNILNASNAAMVGYWSGDQTFGNWQAASAGDANSYSGVPVVYVSSSSDLHLVTTTGTNAAADGKATPIAAITTDIDNDVRNATTPDLGADEFTQGPLSVAVEFFKGKRQGNINLLEWKAGCSSNSITFEMERSSDGRKFAPIGKITASQARCSLPFDFTDAAPANGINYYRLKMTEIDGKLSYSFIIAIINKKTGFEIINMLPSIVTNGAALLNVSSAKNDNLQIIVSDITGKLLLKQTYPVIAGSNAVKLDLSSLANGTYQLSGYSEEGLIRTIRFMKQ